MQIIADNIRYTKGLGVMAISPEGCKKSQSLLTERIVQECLYWWTLRKGHHWQAPNVYVFDWESDLLSVTEAGFTHEFEIKLSRADFKADAHKVGKHDIVVTGSRTKTARERFRQHYHAKNFEDRIIGDRPNYFWYVCPNNMVTLDEIPPHAGLITISWNPYVQYCHIYDVLKKAPRLHNAHLSITQMSNLLNSIYFRYWRLRNHLSAGQDLVGIEKPSQTEPITGTLPDTLTESPH